MIRHSVILISDLVERTSWVKLLLLGKITCIDLIFIRHQNLKLFKSGICYVNILDHSLIAVVMSKQNPEEIILDNKDFQRINFEGVEPVYSNAIGMMC